MPRGPHTEHTGSSGSGKEPQGGDVVRDAACALVGSWRSYERRSARRRPSGRSPACPSPWRKRTRQVTRRRRWLWTRRSWKGKVRAGSRDQALAWRRIASTQPRWPAPFVALNLTHQVGERGPSPHLVQSVKGVALGPSGRVRLQCKRLPEGGCCPLEKPSEVPRRMDFQ